MAKRRATLFVRLKRESAAAGKVRVFSITPELVKALGQGKTLLFQGKVYAVSTNGRVVFKLAHNSYADVLPRDDGIALTATGTVSYTAVGDIVFVMTTATDMMHNVDLMAEVDASSGAAVESVEFSLDVTIIEI